MFSPLQEWRELKDFLDRLELRIDFDREELRAIFALGVIATLLTIKGALTFQILGLPVSELATFLVYGWGIYVFFMGLGISSDWVGETYAKLSYLIAYGWFVGTVVSTASVALDAAILWLLSLVIQPSELVQWIVVGLTILFGIFRFAKKIAEQALHNALFALTPTNFSTEGSENHRNESSEEPQSDE
jgi:hypothetical protein